MPVFCVNWLPIIQVRGLELDQGLVVIVGILTIIEKVLTILEKMKTKKKETHHLFI